MSLSPFQVGRGYSQLRVESADADAGDYVFVLGDLGRAVEQLTIGDYIEVTQSFTKIAVGALARAVLRVTTHEVVTLGAVWSLKVIYDGVTYYERILPADGKTRVLRDAAAGLLVATPPANITFRLELVAA